MQFASLLPKKIHQIWLGLRPVPVRLELFARHWRSLHPRWDYRLWTDQDAAELVLINRAAFDSAANYGMKSDVLRYEILYQHGGLYADLDVECLRSFDPLLEQVEHEAFAGLEHPTPSNRESVGNAILGSLPQSPFIAQLVARLPGSKLAAESSRAAHGAEFTSRATGPAFLTAVTRAFGRITLFPTAVLTGGANSDVQGYAHHHYAGTWRS